MKALATPWTGPNTNRPKSMRPRHEPQPVDRRLSLGGMPDRADRIRVVGHPGRGFLFTSLSGPQ